MQGFVSTPKSKETLAGIYQSRYLIIQLIKRDIFVRYKQTSLGWLWAVINPLVTIMLFFIVFGMLVKIPTPEYNASYAVVLISALLFWNLFASSMSSAGDALINNIGLITKVYFPRVSLCIASAAVSLFDFLIAMLVFMPLALIYGVHFQPLHFICLIPTALLFLLLGTSMGLFIAILKLKFKDFRHIIPLLTQTLFYASPIVYTAGIVPEKYQMLYHLNPLTGAIELARWSFIGGSAPLNPAVVIYSVVATLILFVMSSYYFMSNERSVVDFQ
jgi:lipopolysaccharide transport system permease protein